MPLLLLDRDITTMETDAIVNAANTDLRMGGGVCGAVFRGAGPDKMQAACSPLAPIKTGDAVITPGFSLPARYVIHTAGPVYRKLFAQACRKQLRSCYLNSLSLALENGCTSIAFPLISAGIYGYPRDEALLIAEESIREFLSANEMDVYLLLREKGPGSASPELLAKVRAYVDSLLPEETPDHAIIQSIRMDHSFSARTEAPSGAAPSGPAPSKAPKAKRPPKAAAPYMDSAPAEYAASNSVHAGLERLIGNLDESFSQTLLRLIDKKGRTDVDVYKRANLDRKLFSKIRTGKSYVPSKRTALALAISLELDLKETEDLLARAGYALSHSQKFDVIVEYFILHHIYDILLINETLFQYDQPLLGS